MKRTNYWQNYVCLLCVVGVMSLLAFFGSRPGISQSSDGQTTSNQAEGESSSSGKNSSTVPAIQVGTASISKQEFQQRLKQRVQRKKMRQKMRQMRKKGKKGKGNPSTNLNINRAKIKNELKQEAIKQLVLEHHANKAGITVKDSEVQKKWKEIVNRFGSEKKLTKRLKKAGKSKSGLRQDIRNYLRIKKFVEKKTDRKKVTEQEVRDFYDKNKKKMGNKSFKKSKGKIRNMLEQKRLREARTKLIERLKKNTEIDVNL